MLHKILLEMLQKILLCAVQLSSVSKDNFGLMFSFAAISN